MVSTKLSCRQVGGGSADSTKRPNCRAPWGDWHWLHRSLHEAPVSGVQHWCELGRSFESVVRLSVKNLCACTRDQSSVSIPGAFSWQLVWWSQKQPSRDILPLSQSLSLYHSCNRSAPNVLRTESTRVCDDCPKMKTERGSCDKRFYTPNPVMKWSIFKYSHRPYFKDHSIAHRTTLTRK